MLIFSDLHYGISDDNERRLDDVDQCIDWIIEEAQKRNEKTCVFAGDWSHNRYKLSTQTADRMKNAIGKLNDNFNEVYLIAGNHDYYHNDDHQVCILNLFSGFKNVTLVTKTALPIKYNNKNILLAPWFYDPNEEISRYDAVIGHFEFVGAKLANRISERGYSITSLLAAAPLIFSGHYHLTSEIEREAGKIIVIGAPYQQDWSDFGNKKRIIFFDGVNYESVYNTISPTYNKIPYEKIKDVDGEKLKKLFAHPAYQGGFTKLTVNGEVDYDKLQRIVSVGAGCGLRTFEPDYISITSTISESVNSEMEKGPEKSLKEYVIDFVNKTIDIENSPFSSVSKQEIIELVDNYFERLK